MQNTIHSLNLFHVHDKNPYLYKACIDSWKRHCPEKEIIVHDESDLGKVLDSNVRLYILKDALGADSFEYRVLASLYAKLYILMTYGGWFVESDLFLNEPLPKIDESKSYFVDWNGFSICSYRPIFSNKNSKILKQVYLKFISAQSYQDCFGALDYDTYGYDHTDLENILSYNISVEHFCKLNCIKIINNRISAYTKLNFNKYLFTDKLPEVLDKDIHYCCAYYNVDWKSGTPLCNMDSLVLHYKFLSWHFKKNLGLDFKDYSIIEESIKDYTGPYGGFDDNMDKI